MLASINYTLRRWSYSNDVGSIEFYDCFLGVSDCCIRIRPVTRISQGGVQLDLVGDHSSGGLGAQPPDADNNLIFDVL